MKRTRSIENDYYPEKGAGGYTSLDGTIEFYLRVNSLLDREHVVLDFGAGRGAALTESESTFKQSLMTLRGKVSRVTACDIDKAVLENPGCDESIVIKAGIKLPFDDESFDLIVSDFVFEHITDPIWLSDELARILRPGGWVCARTPNKYCLVSIITRLIPNSRHARLLRKVQPARKSIDVFPTVFKLNSKAQISACFTREKFDNFTYRYEAEPSYFFGNRYLFLLMLFVNKISPPVMKSGLFIFLRKK